MKCYSLDTDTKALVIKIKELSENIEILTKVTAISIAKDELFKGKKENGEKIKALEVYDLPDKIIALIIGSTPNSVKSIRCQARGSKENKKEQLTGVNNNGKEAI
jgi:hypothetical protein